jgi:cytochrome b involved in lipid metabolism
VCNCTSMIPCIGSKHVLRTCRMLTIAIGIRLYGFSISDDIPQQLTSLTLDHRVSHNITHSNTCDRRMKLHTVYPMTVLALTIATREEVEIGRAGRFLADREVLMSELATHATYANSLWTALDGIVYDITDFTHPPGEKYILKVGGMEADDLYMEAYNAKYHPYTIADVVSQPGITRIGPLVYDPPTAPVSPVSPVASDAPVTSDSPVASGGAVSSDAPVTADSLTDAPAASSPEAVPTDAPSALSPVSAATKEPTEGKNLMPTTTETSPTASPMAAAPTSNGSYCGGFGFASSTMVVVSMVMAYM